MIRPNPAKRSRHTSVVVLTAVFLLALCAPAFAEATFTVRGHGFGHGIGMSQYGAKGMAEHGASYSSILSHFYQGTTLGSLATEPIVRVAIQKDDISQGYWTVRGNNADIWVDYPGRSNSTSNFASGGYLVLPKGQAFTVTPLGSTTKITIRDQNSVPKGVITGSWVHLWERDTTKPRYSGLVQIMHATGPFDRQNMLYHGSLKLERGTTSTTNTLLHARNYVYLEDYVKCVVPRESPASWATEAIKAQAVAARSYAYVGLKPASSFDMYCTTRSQVYNGWGQWDSVDGSVRHGDNPDTVALEGDWQSDPEVAATKLQLVKYGTTTVMTYFHSSSGGHTEDIDKAWPSSAAQPYYQGVPDPYGTSAYDDWGPWTYTATEVRSRLLGAGIPAADVPATITDMRVTKRGDSGRVMEIVLYGGVGETPKTLSGSTAMSRVRNAIAGSYDTWFYINAKTARIAGEDRYETSTKLSKAAFSTASSVVIANGSSFADALAASGLAGTVNAPLLLVTNTSAPDGVMAEIRRLGATKAYVIGGGNAISDSVIYQLRTIPVLAPYGQIERISGVDRYDTARKIALKIQSLKGGGPLPRAVIVSGTRFADAVAVSPLAFRKDLPVLLVNGDVPSSYTVSGLAAIKATQLLVVGGDGVVTPQAVSSLGIPSIRIAAGANRYDTAGKLADYMVASEGFTWDIIQVANGNSLVDALSAGPYAGRWNGPLLYSSVYSVPVETTGRLVLHKGVTDHAYLLGGTFALNNVIEAKVEQSLW